MRSYSCPLMLCPRGGPGTRWGVQSCWIWVPAIGIEIGGERAAAVQGSGDPGSLVSLAIKSCVTLDNLLPLLWEKFQTFVNFCLYKKRGGWDNLKAPSRKPGSMTAWSKTALRSIGRSTLMGKKPHGLQIGSSLFPAVWLASHQYGHSVWFKAPVLPLEQSRPYCRLIKAILTSKWGVQWTGPTNWPRKGRGGNLSTGKWVCLFVS